MIWSQFRFTFINVTNRGQRSQVRAHLVTSGGHIWVWIGTDFIIVISVQKSTFVQIMIDFGGGRPAWPLTFGNLWRSHLWKWIGTDFTIVTASKTVPVCKIWSILDGVTPHHLWPWWPLEVTFMNVNRNGIPHRNQRPKQYLCANFDRFWRGHLTWSLTFGDLWRSPRGAMNVNRKGPHHSNQRPKEYLYANFDRFWRGGGVRMCRWMWMWCCECPADLWRSSLWMWIGMDFNIVISVQKSTCVQILIDFVFGGCHLTWPLTFVDLWRSRLWMWIGTDFTIVISMSMATCVPRLDDFGGGLNVSLNVNLDLLLTWQTCAIRWGEGQWH